MSSYQVGGAGVVPGHELIDLALRVAGHNAGDDACGSMSLSLAVSMSEAKIAQ